MQPEGVAIAYIHSQAVTYSWHASMSGLWRWDLGHAGHIYRHGAEIAIHHGTGGLVAARNQAIREFLSVERLSWLWWVDTDMGFAPDTVDRLLEAADPSERPIVGGLCFVQKLPEKDGLNGYQSFAVPTIYDWDAAEHIFRARIGYLEDRLVRCAGTGSACILIHRSVFERIRGSQGEAWYDHVPTESALIGEDLSFCLRAATLEIPVYVHTGVKTNHQKTVWLNEDYFQAVRVRMMECATA